MSSPPPQRVMRQYELVDRVRSYNPQANEDLLNRAYVYAMRAHGSQTRASGDLFFSHPLEVAAILTEFKLDDATIAAAVLHDTIEDTHATREEIERLFGVEIARLVDGLTKLKRLDLVSKQAQQAENLRKLLLAVSEDVRVLLVKLADRLHNMRTLHHMPESKRERIAQETLDIYAPLAARMGMHHLHDELENLAFQHLEPQAYQMIATRLEDLQERNGVLIETIEKELKSELGTRGIPAQVYGRQKAPYSIFRKMESKSLSFDQLSDIFAFRVLVSSLEDCYRVIGIVHTKWPAVPGRFKDYISTPKQNDYRSLHTTVVGPGRQRVELQIRSYDMHEVAEYGIAAHAFYKDGQIGGPEMLSRESGAYQWLRRTIDLLSEGDSPEEFLEHTKLELFRDQVFCFTPKGRLVALPKGATPIDFAYAIHTNIGNSAVSAKINGRPAPLVSHLQNGDEVEILRVEGQSPPAVWETIVVTGKARAAIRRATKEAVRAQYSGLGRQIIVRAFERAKRPFSDEKLRIALHRLARQHIEDVYSAVGRGEMFSGDVVRAVYPDFKEDRKLSTRSLSAKPKKDPGWFGLKKAASLVFKIPGSAKGGKDITSIPIRGLTGDLPVRFAPHGGALPGDRIVGILTPGEGITIYPIQSPALIAFDDQLDRWLDVRWEVEPNSLEVYPARIMITTLNEPGALGQISTTIGDLGANIDSIEFVTRSADIRDIIIDVEVHDLKHLNRILTELRYKPVVSKAERVNG